MGMVRAGAILVLLGVGALVAYGVYVLLLVLYTGPDVPLVLKLDTPVASLGLILLLVAVMRDRLRVRGREYFEEGEH